MKMTMAEVQLLTYANAILRQRGYKDVADQLAGVVGVEAEQFHDDSPPVGRHLRAVS